MSQNKRTDIDLLVSLPEEEFAERARAAAERIELRDNRALAECRDMTQREKQLTGDDKAELEAIRKADAIREHSQRNRDIIDTAIHTRAAPQNWVPTLVVSPGNLQRHAAAIRQGQPFGAIEPIETRSQVTAGSDMGSAGAWSGGQPQQPRHLITFAGVPVSPLTGKKAQVPQYTGPTGVAGVDEGTDHGEFDTLTKVDLTALRYGRWTDVSSIVGELDSLQSINTLHAWGIARDLDLLAVGDIETAASFPVPAGGDLELAVRGAVLEVAAQTYNAETDLVIFGTPADLSLLLGTVPTSGPDVESFAVRFNGARLYPAVAASAGQVTVFAPNAFRCFQTGLQSFSLISPKDGSHTFGSWLHSTELAQQIVGSAAAVETSGS